MSHSTTSLAFLDVPGETAALMQAMDRKRTPFGPVDTWSIHINMRRLASEGLHADKRSDPIELPCGKGERVLVVENDPALRMLVLDGTSMQAPLSGVQRV